MNAARPQRGGLAAVAALALTTLASCGEDPPDPADVASAAAAANTAIASGDLAGGASGFEDAAGAAADLEDAEVSEALTSALTSAGKATGRLVATDEQLALAREELAGPERYEPELASTAKDLTAQRAGLVRAGVRLRAANEALQQALPGATSAELRAQALGLDRAVDELREELRSAVRRARSLARPHPFGPLRADGIGPVDFGDRAVVAKRAFGLSEREEEVGFGLGPPPRLDWIYRSEPGFRLIFDANEGTVAGYSCERRCSLRTRDGIGVGDPLAKVRRQHRSRLRDYPVGVGAVSLAAGRPGSFPALVFTPALGRSDRLIGISAFDTVAGPAGD